MSNKSLYRPAVVFSIIAAMGWLLFILGSLSGQPGGDAGVVANDLARAGSTSILLYTWGGVVGSLAVIPVLLAFYQGFKRETDSVLLVPLVFSLVGVAFLTMGFIVDTGSMIYYYGPTVASYSGTNADLVVQAAQFAQDSIEVTWAIGSFLAYGGPILWMALLFMRMSSSPRWLHLGWDHWRLRWFCVAASLHSKFCASIHWTHLALPQHLFDHDLVSGFVHQPCQIWRER